MQLRTPEWSLDGYEPYETQVESRRYRAAQMIKVEVPSYPETHLIIPSGDSDDVKVMYVKGTSLVCLVSCNAPCQFVGLTVFDVDPGANIVKVRAFEDSDGHYTLLEGAEVEEYGVSLQGDACEERLGRNWEKKSTAWLIRALSNGRLEG